MKSDGVIGFLVAAIVVVIGLIGFIVFAHKAEGDELRPCTEDMACWDCETMGDHVCGTDRWVLVTQNRNGAISIGRYSPQVAVRRFYLGRGFVCLTQARRADGSIDRFRVCHD